MVVFVSMLFVLKYVNATSVCRYMMKQHCYCAIIFNLRHWLEFCAKSNVTCALLGEQTYFVLLTTNTLVFTTELRNSVLFGPEYEYTCANYVN